MKKLIWIPVFALMLSAATIDPKGDKVVLAAGGIAFKGRR